MKIVELPLPLCQTGKLSVVALQERESALDVGWSAWLSDTYSFDGSEPPASFRMIAQSRSFAQSGVVIEDYPADTETIDLKVGMIVMLRAPDNILNEPSVNDGLADELLVFFAGEIMAVVSIEMVAGGAYRLMLSRSRYGTGRAAATAGDEVHLIARSALVPIEHPSFIVGYSGEMKFARESGDAAVELEDVDAVAFEITGAAFNIPPLNLRVNGASVNATFAAAADVRFDWSLSDQKRGAAEDFGLKVRTLFQILKMDETVLWQKLTYQQFIKITGAKMTTILGGETQFILSLSTDSLGREFHFVSEPQMLTVNQI